MRFIFYFVLLRWFFRICFLAQTDPIETLTVRLEADVSDLLNDVPKAVKESSDELKKLGDAAEKAGKRTTDSAGRMRDELGRFVKKTDEGRTKVKGFGVSAGAAFGLAAGAASKLLNVIVGLITSAVQLFKGLTSQAVQLAGNFEQVQLTFTNIFKDRGQANAFLKGLQVEAAKLGISFNSAGQFAKSLFPDTSGIEQFNELLRVGAVAAADANRPLEDLIFTLNNAVAGQFESIKEILDLPPETLAELRAAPGDIDVLIASLDKLFTKRGINNLEEAGSTLQGLQRRIKGFTEELLLVAGLEILVPLREGFQKFFDILQENRPALDEIASGIGEVIGIIINFAREEIFGSFNLKGPLEGIKNFIGGIKSALGPVLAFVAEIKRFVLSLLPLGKALVFVVAVFTPLGRAVSLLVALWPRINEALVTGAKVLALSAAGWKGLLATLAPIGEVITKIAQALLALASGDFTRAGRLASEAMGQIKEGLFDVDGGIKAMEDSIKESAISIDKWTNPVKEATKAVEGLDKAMSDAADTAEQKPLLDPAQLEKFGDRLDEAVQNRAKKQAELEQANIEKINKIVADGNEKRLGIDKKFDEALIDLAQDSEEKRAKVIEDTRRELADLGKSTDQQIASRRSEFNKSELRQTEDHLKAMRQLQDDFLFNLDDAVRDRDAGAIVDLQRQFKKESARRENDFSTNQSRQGQDFNKELSGIRENEAQRREELLTAQTEQLDNITKFEEEKRLDLETRRQEEQEKLEINLAETLQKENDNFIARQAALDEALQKQLESIAKNLADQKDVTEEGAREILETFDKFFGIGGDIDKLMEDFARKRKIRADITVAFQGTAAPQTPAQAIASGGTFGGRQRLGGVQEFIGGGTLVAQKPTLALFGETPEVVQFTPMSELSSPGQSEPGRMIVELTGSAPPGVGAGERDAIAAVLLTALQDSGALQ